MKMYKRLAFVLVLAAGFFMPGVVDAANTICNTYSDGCTICDFYNAQGKYTGYIEWCH
jgi:hypothetical protein